MSCKFPARVPAVARSNAFVRNSLLAIAACLPVFVHAGATGESVVAGRAEFARQGGDLTVEQHTDQAIINWQDFSIDSGTFMRFLQPGADSAVLNRVISGNASELLGNLDANGRVFLINPNGVLIGDGATIDTGAFLASTLDVADADFLDGGDLSFAGSGTGEIANLGTILGADVFLIAPSVSNSGTISADGSVGLAAGSQVLLREHGRQRLWVGSGSLGEASGVSNAGVIEAAQAELQAAGGNVYALSINNTGVVRATTVQKEGGRILLRGGAGGNVLSSGTLDASSESGAGGRIEVSGSRVALTGESLADASGATGGGEVLIGGDYQGGNADVPNAERTFIGAGAELRANAGESGDGGKVIVWADDDTRFFGGIEARGGAQGGDGGFIEVSGKEHLQFAGSADASAPFGASGTLLLDPKNILVENGGAAPLADADAFADNPAADVTIAPNSITAVANTGTAVFLQANNDITVDSAIVSSNGSGAGGALSFQAGRSITLNANINSDDGDVSFTANDAGAEGAQRDDGAAEFINNSLVDAGTGSVSIILGTQGESGSISTGQISAGTLNVTHSGPSGGGVVDLGEIELQDNLAVTTNGRDVTNVAGRITVRNRADIDSGSGDIQIDHASTNFQILSLTGRNAVINDTDAIQIGATDLSGTLDVTSHGPMAGFGGEVISVGGEASFTANSGGFGVATPYVDLHGAGHDFAGTVNIDVPGGYARIRDANALDLGTVTVWTDLHVTTGGDLTDSGTLTIPRYTRLTTDTHGVTLDSSDNDFNYLQIVSAGDASIVDQSAITFGNQATNGHSSISGDLDITAGGTISQWYGDSHDYSRVAVGGNASFTVTAADSDLLLGPIGISHDGAQNSFAGTVTMTATGGGSFRNIQLRNVHSNAAVISGLADAGTLNDVLLRFDNAPSLELPGMTIGGDLTVLADSGGITQSGAVNVDAGRTLLRASNTGDITLAHADNDFHQLTIESARNATIVDTNAIEIYGNLRLHSGDLSLTAGSNITDSYTNSTTYLSVTDGTVSLDAGTHDVVLDNPYSRYDRLTISAAGNATITPRHGVTLGDIDVTGTFTLDSWSGGALDQLSGTRVHTGSTTTFGDFVSGTTLDQPDNVMGDLAIYDGGPVTIRENDAITQAAAWHTGGHTVALTTSNDQAIDLGSFNNTLGHLSVTQINDGAASAGAVRIRETDGNGITQSGPWVTHGDTRLDAGGYGITLNDSANVLGPLQVLGGTHEYWDGSEYVKYGITIFEHDTIADYAAWATAEDTPVTLRAYAGGVSGAGNVLLTQSGNVLGDLSIQGRDVTITENSTITDGEAWITTGGTTTLDPGASGSHGIALDNLSNELGALFVTGSPADVLITDNTDLTQAAAWTIGAAPVTVDARAHAIDLSHAGNVFGDLAVVTENGVASSLSVRENDVITQAGPWALLGVPVTLHAENGAAITVTDSANQLGDLTVTGGTVTIRENDAITQDGAWTTTGTTSLDATDNAITLDAAANVLGDLALANTSDVDITENDDITQAGPWSLADAAIELNAQSFDVLLTEAANVLGDLTITGANAHIAESDLISDGAGWTVPGLTTLAAGAHDIVLDANPAGNLGTVAIVSANDAEIRDVDGLVFDASTVAGRLAVQAGGEVTQVGAITADELHLTGSGFATLTDAGNDVADLAAGFSGGDLTYTDADDVNVAVIGGTTGINIGANDVALTSVAGTVTGLTSVNANSSSLTVDTGAALELPQITIDGAQTYTAGGSGITLTAGVSSTAPGAITFNSAAALAADLSVQSSNSAILFDDTLSGAGHQLIVNAGNGQADFHGQVAGLGSTASANTALQLTSGGATFHSTLDANNGLAVTGPVTFLDTVTLADGNAGSVFAGQVTLGRSGGMGLSGYDGMTFNGGVVLQNGPAMIASNGSTLTFQGANTVRGPFDLELNAGSANIVGLDHLGTDLTGLHVVAGTINTPAAGITIAGRQSYLATEPGGINLGGDLQSTAAGAITFHSPVNLTNSVLLTTTGSDVVFMDTLNGGHDLTLATGIGEKVFFGSVGASAPVGDGTGAALTLQGSGAGLFAGTLQTSSGINAAGPVTFQDNVTLGDGDTGSSFAGVVTAGALSLSGHDGFDFLAGMNLLDGPLTVVSHGADITLAGPVSGAQALTLDSLSGGSGTVTGLQHIAGDLTGLTVTGQTLSLPATGLAVAGPMDFTAPGGMSLNGDVGDGGTGAVTFQGPVTLANQDVAVSTNNAAILFDGSITGPHNLTVASGTGVKDFSGTVDIGSGSGSALSLTGSGAATFQQAVELASGLLVEDAADVRLHGDLLMADGDTGSNFGTGTVTLGAAGETARLHGHDGLLFGGAVQLVDGAVEIQSLGGDLTIEGALRGDQPLTLAGGGGSSAYFNGPVGGAAADTIVGGGQGLSAAGFAQLRFADDVNLSGGLDVVGDVEFRGDVSTAAGAISNRFGGDVTFNAIGGTHGAFAGLTEFLGAVTLASSDVSLQAGDYLRFIGPVDGAHSLTIDGDETVAFDRVGSSDPLASLAVAADEVTLSNAIATAGGGATFTGPVVLHGDASVSSNGGDIRFVGSTSTIDGGHDLTLAAGTGNVDLGGVVGGIDPLTSLNVSGYDLSLPRAVTTPVTAQTYTALNDLTLTQSRSMNGPVQFFADADGDGSGSFVLLDGVSLTAVNNDLGIVAADLDMQGSSTLNSGSGQIGLGATAGRSVGIGDDAAGPDRMHVSNDELSRMSSTGGLAVFTALDGDINVGTVGNADTSNLTGVLALDAGLGGDGNVNFIGDSVFQGIAATAGGVVDVNSTLTTRGGDVVLHSAAAVTAPAAIDTDGGDLSVQGTLNLDSDLNVTSAGGHVSFASRVDGPGDLGLSLAAGDVSGLEQLQATVGDLHVSADGTIAVTDVTTGGTQTYVVGELDLHGTLQASGIAANGPVVLSGNSTLDAGAGALDLQAGLDGGAHDLVLTADTMNAGAALQGAGTWHVQPGSAGRDVKVGGAAIGGAQLDLDDEFVGQISADLAGLMIGRADGTGDIRVAADSVPDSDLTLISPGGHIAVETDLDLGDATLAMDGRSLGQTGAISSAALDLTANGGAIDLTAIGNDFGPVALGGTPTAVGLRNGRDIVQSGSWDLAGVDVTLDAGPNDIDLGEAGNRFGALSLTADNAAVASAQALELGVTDLDGSLNIAANGTVSQSGGLSIGGDLSVATTHAAGTVALANSQATRLGTSLVGGDFNLNANGQAVSQDPGASLQVAGTFDPTGSGDVSLGGSGNLLPGYTPTGGANDITAQGVIELGTINEAGDLVVVSEASSISFDGGPVAGDAVVLTDAGNSIGGSVSFTTDAPAITAGPDVQTGIRQGVGTTLTVAGQASFTAAPSSVPGSGFVDLTNSGNTFGSLLVSGRNVDVRQESGTLMVDGATASDSLQLTAIAGGVSQTGAIRTPALAVAASGDVTLTETGNEVAVVAASTDGGSFDLHSGTDLEIGTAAGLVGVDTTGGDLGLTTGGSLSQSEALANVGALAVDAAGTIDLSHAGNTLASVASMAADGDVALENAAAGLRVSGDVTTNNGSVSVVTAGDLSLDANAAIEITGSGDVVLAAGQDFINDSVDHNIALDDGRFLIYSQDPNRTEQGGLTADGSLFNRSYAADGPQTILHPGSQFIYSLVPVLTFSPESLAVLYGQEPVLTYTFEGLMSGHTAEMVFSGAPSLTSAATAGSAVGTYAIGIGAGSLVSEIGYEFDFDAAGALVTVNPASLTITAHDHGRLYGAANPLLTYSTSGFVLGESIADLDGFSVATAATESSSVGTYGIVASATSSNYDLTFVDGTLSVDPAPLTITAHDQSRLYGAANPALTYTADGFVLGEDVSVLSGFAVATPAAQNADVGAYVIAAAGTSSNYDLNFVDGTLSVNPAPLTITAHDQSRLYGAANPALTYTADGFVLGEDVSVLNGFAVATPAAQNADAGAYAIAAEGASSNYDLNFVDGTLSVNPAPLTITAHDQSRLYGAANPALTYTADGFVLGEDVSVLNGFAVATPATQNADAGAYAIAAEGTSSNYDVNFVDGALSVNPAPLTITAHDQSRLYGASNPTLTYTADGFVLGEDVSALSSFAVTTPATPGSDVGAYAIAAGGASSNYDLNFVDGTLNIDPATLTLHLDDQSRRYGAADPVFTYDLSGFVLGEGASVLSALEVSSAAGAGADVGDYGITASAAAPNYVVDVLDAVLSITPAPLQIAVQDAERNYGADNPEFAYSAQGFVLGEDASALSGFAINTSATEASNVGDYALRAAGSSSNYDVSFIDGTLAIRPAALTLQVHDQSRTYGSANPELTYTADGFVLGQNVSDLVGFSVQTSAAPGSDVGAYAITASASASNYVLTVENGMLTIDPARVLIELHDQRRLYGSENPELSYSASGFVLGDDLADLDGVSVTTAATVTSAVGDYAISGNVAGELTSNYAVDIVDALLTVDPAPLQISVEDAVRAFGSEDLSYFATVSGFVNGEDIGVLEGALSINDTTALFAPSGVYDSALVPSGVSAANYTIDFAAGDLTIAPMAVNGSEIIGSDGGELFEGQNKLVFRASQNRELGSPILPLFPFNSIEARDVDAKGAFSYRTNPFFDVNARRAGEDEEAKRVWVHATTFGAR